jgi:hypothetical protein
VKTGEDELVLEKEEVMMEEFQLKVRKTGQLNLN